MRLLQRLKLVSGCMLALLLQSGCAVHIPSASPYSTLDVPAGEAPEALLLDVGIVYFSADENSAQRRIEDPDSAMVAAAEARYMPVLLQHTLVQSGRWGSVRVLPVGAEGSELLVTGSIIESAGHTLELEIRVADASGTQWYRRRYTEHVGDNVYSDTSLGVNDPFQGLYNRIANDMLEYLQQELDAADLRRIRQVAEMKFGRRFAPEMFTQYLREERRGRSSIARLPAEDDPLRLRLREIRQRDHEFHELLQTHYLNYARRISDVYFLYRKFSYQQLRELQHDQLQARNRMLKGAFWLGVAVATSDIDDLLGSTVSAAAAIKGSSDLIGGARAYPADSDVLEQMRESFAVDVNVDVMQLDHDVIVLSGSVEEIYRQWQQILAELFLQERGTLSPSREGEV